jgi:hypothetical protein
MRILAQFDHGSGEKAISIPCPIRSAFLPESDHHSWPESDHLSEAQEW